MVSASETIKRNLLAEMARRGIHAREMANIMGIGLSTWYKRLDEPGEFRVAELTCGVKLMGLQIEDLTRRQL